MEKNIWLILKKHREINDYQKLILQKIKDIGYTNKIKVKVFDLFDEQKFDKDIDRINDIVLFDKNFAYNNIDVVKSCTNGIVLIENETVFFRRINELNPINEQLAINHNFKISYLTDKKENTNNDYRILVDNKNFIKDLNKILH